MIIPNIEKIIAQLEKGSMPKKVMFSQGGENNKFWKKIEMFGPKQDSKKFLDYLKSDEWYELLKRNIYSY